MGARRASPRATKRAPTDFEPDADLTAWAAANAPSVDLRTELAKLKDHTFATARSDWPATLRNWLRKAQQDASTRRPSAVAATGETPRQRAARERVYEMTGGLVSAMPPGQTTEYIDVVARPIVSLG